MPTCIKISFTITINNIHQSINQSWHQSQSASIIAIIMSKAINITINMLTSIPSKINNDNQFYNISTSQYFNSNHFINKHIN